jgi:hypothetical protein
MSETFQTALFFWAGDIARRERVNIGLALFSRPHRFCDMKFIGASEMNSLVVALGYSREELFCYEALHGYATSLRDPKELSRPDLPFRWDHPFPFVAMIGVSNQMSSLQWESGPCGLLGGRTPQQTLDELFARFVSHRRRS